MDSYNRLDSESARQRLRVDGASTRTSSFISNLIDQCSSQRNVVFSTLLFDANGDDDGEQQQEDNDMVRVYEHGLAPNRDLVVRTIETERRIVETPGVASRYYLYIYDPIGEIEIDCGQLDGRTRRDTRVVSSLSYDGEEFAQSFSLPVQGDSYSHWAGGHDTIRISLYRRSMDPDVADHCMYTCHLNAGFETQLYTKQSLVHESHGTPENDYEYKEKCMLEQMRKLELEEHGHADYFYASSASMITDVDEQAHCYEMAECDDDDDDDDDDDRASATSYDWLFGEGWQQEQRERQTLALVAPGNSQAYFEQTYVYEMDDPMIVEFTRDTRHGFTLRRVRVRADAKHVSRDEVNKPLSSVLDAQEVASLRDTHRVKRQRQKMLDERPMSFRSMLSSHQTKISAAIAVKN